MAIVRSAHAAAAEGLADAGSSAPLRTRRAEVLACLEDAGEPTTVAVVAERTDLHVNTARFHLDALVADRLAERSAESSGSPGRPRILYRARPRPSGPRSYRLLGRMLSGLVADLDPDGSAAVRTGQAWGRELVDAAPGTQDADEALVRLDALMDDVGFDPVTTPRRSGAEVQLRHCPFLEVAADQSDVVCGLHRGLIEGALEQIHAPLAVEELRPFVGPGLCVARLRSR
ncbi:MAG TPA: helix-turn-helix domain-containing protein [Marmoricola sp.]|nr:helix-turn-helix domain-containing protein [Marmoricola sp.]